MIDDLVFKGKSIEDAIAKAANFFGVDQGVLKYEEIEAAESDLIAIRLVENPIAPRRTHEDHAETNRYGLLRSESLPKSRNRQYEHPVTTGEQKPATKTKPVKHQKSSQPKKKNGHQRNHSTDTRRKNVTGHKKNGGKNNFRKPKPRQQQPQIKPDPNWQPSEVDTSQMSEFERKAYEFVTEVLRNMDMQAEAKPIHDDDRLIMNIDGPDRSLLLNRKGEPLVAIQYLVNKIFLGPDSDEESTPVYVDSRGYRIARDEELYEIAVASAEKVKMSGKEYSLNPMNPYERRQIHIALKDNDQVETVSRGNGYIKRVSILPAR
jgi:spoIIIJ-associated protein